MKFAVKYISLFLLFATMLGFSQENSKKTDRDNFDNYAYMVDIESFEDLSKKGFTPEEIHKHLGNANYLNAKYDVASYWYGKLFEKGGVYVNPDYMYRYAQSLKSLEQYKESNAWMSKFEVAKANDGRSTKFKKNVDYLEEIEEIPRSYAIKHLATINSEASDFAPSYYLNGLVFTTNKNNQISEKKRGKQSNKAYSNLFKTGISGNGEFSYPDNFSSNLNTGANESSTVFTKNGKTVYFTRNNYRNGTFNRDKEGISRLKICRANFQNGKWTNGTELPFNNDRYSVAHPSLSPDGTKLFFSSDMPGTLGASDIFAVDIHADGSFGTPRNLGPKINTEGKETFPFIASTGILYFASDGHPGLGGLDIFSIDLNDGTKVTNLGRPINSKVDDFSLVMDEHGQTGFFASNRKGGSGGDDIYSFTSLSDCTFAIEGMASDKDTEAPLPGTLITAYGNNNNILGETKASENGTFAIEMECQENQYTLVGTKTQYEKGTIYMLTSPIDKKITNARMELEQLSRVAAVGDDLVKVLKLTPIYFDLNSSYLRKDAYAELDKVVDYMRKRPDIKIAVGSHTDSREGDNYNLWLSARRAKRTVDYIVSQGIDKGRISGKGYGETQLINHCKNGVRCADSEHQLNRRSEFIVIKK